MYASPGASFLAAASFIWEPTGWTQSEGSLGLTRFHADVVRLEAERRSRGKYRRDRNDQEAPSDGGTHVEVMLCGPVALGCFFFFFLWKAVALKYLF